MSTNADVRFSVGGFDSTGSPASPSGSDRVDPSSFEARYRDEGDPWDFAGSWYEQRRYDVIVSLLPQPRYGVAFEPACSVGELTRRLSLRCDRVIAVDPSPSAIAAATATLGAFAGVELAVGAIPEDWPSDDLDLVVLSEVGYYFDEASFAPIAHRLAASAEDGTCVIAAHWLGRSKDHLRHGDEVHEQLRTVMGLPDCSMRDEGFRVDVWSAHR